MVKKLSVEEVARRRTLLFGFLAVIFGILIFRNGVGFTKFSLDLLAVYFFSRWTRKLSSALYVASQVYFL